MNASTGPHDPVVVEFGHPQAQGGYTEYHTPGRPSAPGKFVEVAHRMPGMQPPTDLPDTTGHSFWGLRVVDVPGYGQYLCFTVQGFGGGFGPSGGTQFVFTPAGVTHPATFWWRCVSAIVPGGRVGLDFSRTTPAAMANTGLDPDAERQRLRQLYWALYHDEQYVTIQGGTSEVGQILGRVLGALPVCEIEGRGWWTCALDLDAVHRTRAVSGRWPGELRTPLLRGRFGPLDKRFQLSEAAAEVRPEPEPGSREELISQAIDQLVSESLALNAGDLGLERPAQSVVDLVQHIVDYELTLNVWTALCDGKGRDRLRKVLPKVRETACEEPVRAMTALVEVRPEAIGEVLVRELLHGIAKSSPNGEHRGGLAPLPYPEPVRAWHSTLERALLIAFKGEDFADTVWSLLMAPGQPLADRSRREEAHEFLEHLNLHWQNQPDMFPLPSRAIAVALRADKQLDRDVLARLARAEQPAAELIRIAQYLGPNGAGGASHLLLCGMAMHERGSLGTPLSDLMKDLLDAVKLPIDEVAAWTCATLEHAKKRRPETCLAVVRGALNRLGKGQDVPLELLSWHLDLMSEDKNQPEADRRVWAIAADQLNRGAPAEVQPWWRDRTALVGGAVGLAVVAVLTLISFLLFASKGVALVTAGGTFALVALIMTWDARNRSEPDVDIRRKRS